ncbi:hypothetical protein ASU31_00285 [Pedobacter ginsenosidimutans]|uniref:TonB-dependent receptor plug domain-containing protein n=2 Tax=Pedobacter ginsenosidimutans TaxID=687842 RepID=A0A0T5VV86_9SPHI|nr:hypothetical protein ASU31_00285 [Pedobacter ginsenosidimutans]
MCRFVSFGQEILKGRLIDETDTAKRIAATIEILQGGQKVLKTRSDDQGNFSLTLASGSYTTNINNVNYKTYSAIIVIPNKELVIFKLSPNENRLDDVTVSTGYQKIDRTRSTGSFDQINNKSLNQQVGKNILDRIEAVGNGITVDRSTSSGPRFMIRGLSTIQGPKEPLIILDDFAYSGELSNINPDDVESITILKDAAAASIWGTRAGNGVIVITTKKGKRNDPLSISFNSALGFVKKPNLRYEQRISSGDFIGLERYLYQKGFYNDQISSPSRPMLTPFVEALILNDAGTLSNDELNARAARFSGHDVYDDFSRYIYQQGINQQYSLSLSGGSEKHNWILSSGYNRNIDNLNSKDERKTLRIANSLSLSKNLKINSSFSYTSGFIESGKQGIGEIVSYLGLYPYAELADQYGNPLAINKNYRQTYLSSPATKGLLDWSYVPLLDYAESDNSKNLTDLLANFDLSYKLPLGFRASLKYNIEEQRNNGELLQSQQSYYTRNLINSFTQIASNGSISYPIPLGAILDKSESTLRSEQFRPQLEFNRIWKDHRIDAVGGLEWRTARTKGYFDRVYGLDTDKLISGLVDYTRTYPDFITGSANFINSGSGLSLKRNNFFSEFVNVAYSFRDTYTISASARADASNLFGVETNNKWKPLWSMGLSWDISKMSFLKTNFVDQLKLKATLGKSGNVDPNMTGVNTIRYQAISTYTQSVFASFDKYSNPDLRWETVRMINIGTDFSLFKGRLSGSIEYYSKNAKDLFGTYPVDYTKGIGNTVVKNVAEISGHGLDIQLQTKNSIGGLIWNTAFNFSSYKDKVLQYYLASQQGSSFLQPNPSVSGIEGLPVYSVFSYKWAGLDALTGDPMGFINGLPSKAYNLLTGSDTKVTDLTYHGSVLPRYFGNIVNSFGYSNITLSVGLSFKFDYYFRRRSIDYSSLFITGAGHADFQNRWKNPGDENFTNIPSMVYPAILARDAFYRYSDVLVEKGDHVRVQYVNLDYNFDNSLLQHFEIKSLSLYTNISNLGIIYRANKQNLDPEYVTSSFNLPPRNTFSIGVRVTL